MRCDNENQNVNSQILIIELAGKASANKKRAERSQARREEIYENTTTHLPENSKKLRKIQCNKIIVSILPGKMEFFSHSAKSTRKSAC